MSKLTYDNIDSNDLDSLKEYSRYYQPNFTINRHIYRGPRESEKINLEIQQLAYDLAIILSMLQTNIDEQLKYSNFYYDGTNDDDINELIAAITYDGSTPVFYSIDELASALNILEHMIKRILRSYYG